MIKRKRDRLDHEIPSAGESFTLVLLLRTELIV